MMKNNVEMMEYKNFAITEDEIDMILSSMGVEHVVVSDGKFVTALFEAKPEQGYAIKRHLDAVLQ